MQKILILSLMMMVTSTYLQASQPSSSSTSYASSAEQDQVPQTYNETIINPSTIIDLAPKAPANIQEKANEFLSNNKEIIDVALGFEKFTLDKPVQLAITVDSNTTKEQHETACKQAYEQAYYQVIQSMHAKT